MLVIQSNGWTGHQIPNILQGDNFTPIIAAFSLHPNLSCQKTVVNYCLPYTPDYKQNLVNYFKEGKDILPFLESVSV